MDFQFKGEAGEEIDVENEYELEIKIESLSLTQHQLGDIQLILIFGDLVHKMTSENGEEFEGRTQNFTMHAVPTELSEKLSRMPIMLYIVSTANDLKPLGSLFVEVNECFANAIKCSDFQSESIKRIYELNEGKVEYGKMTIVFSVSKKIGNSNRHRRFYTEATQEKIQIEKQDV